MSTSQSIRSPMYGANFAACPRQIPAAGPNVVEPDGGMGRVGDHHR